MASIINCKTFPLILGHIILLVLANMKPLKITSYNSTGLNEQRTEFINNLLSSNNTDILFLQETWLYNSTLSKLNDIHNSYMAYGVSGMPDSDEIINGRPYGGVAILWHKSLAGLVKPIKSQSKRLCAVTLTLASGTCVLLINVYMPGDTYSAERTDPEFMDILDEVQIMWLQNEASILIFGGDINTDLRRDNAHSNSFVDFADDNGLTIVWGIDNVSFCNTYVSYDGRSSSCIDHFVVSNNIAFNNLSCTVNECVTNGSNHLPVTLGIDLDISYTPITPTTNKPVGHSIAWHKVTENQLNCYKAMLSTVLNGINIPLSALQCTNVYCNNILHKEALDMYCVDICNACIDIGVKCLPKVHSRKYSKPFWVEKVQPLKVDAIFWDRIWKECGKPEEGVLKEVRQHAKRKYHYAIRNLKRRESELRKERMAEALCKNTNRNFWEEVRKTLPRGKCSAIRIDDIKTDDAICEKFAKIYETLYNSVPSDKHSLHNINECIYKDLNKCDGQDLIITVQEVSKAISLLNSKKYDGEQRLWSNHLIFSPDELKVHVSKLLTSSMVHGYMPRKLLESTIIPIVKNTQGDICNSNNYRGIALSSSLCKVLEIIIMEKYKENLRTSDSQFAFKTKHSTTMCTLILKETVNYYLNRGTDVYCCLVDASKAFDRVRHDKLFEILVSQGIPPIVIRLLIDMHRCQLIRTKWNGRYSRYFNIENGIRQGGILSPVLFTLYMDVLLKRLESKGIGCKIGHKYYGALGYADDLTLLCPSLQGLQDMLDICTEYGIEYDVKYNPDKSECICFSRVNTEVGYNLMLNNEKLKWVKQIKHLGNYLLYNLNEVAEVNHKSRSFIYHVNMILANFKNNRKCVLNKLFESYCCVFYGSQAWNLADKNVNRIYVNWNKAVRKIWNLPYTTHRFLLTGITGKVHIKTQLLSRFIKLYNIMSCSSNDTVRTLMKILQYDTRSIISRNIIILAKELNIARHKLYEGSVQNINIKSAVNTKSNMIKELTECIDNHYGKLYIQNFEVDELKEILKYVATS